MRKKCHLPDETITTENQNGHATSSGTSEEVKVHVEPSEMEEQDRASNSSSKENKTGKSDSSCLELYNTFIIFYKGGKKTLSWFKKKKESA